MSFDAGNYTDQATAVLSNAVSVARDHRNVNLNPLHLASALFSEKPEGSLGRSIARRVPDVTLAQVRQSIDAAIEKTLPQQNPPPDTISGDRAFFALLDSAKKIKETQADSHISVDHLLRAIIQHSPSAQALADAGLPKDQLLKALESVRGKAKVTNRTSDATYDSLSKYAIDLVERAAEGKLDPVIGRDVQIRRCIEILCRRTKNNPILVGDPGVGKTAIAEGLAQRICDGDVPERLQNTHLYSLDMGALIAGASHRGEFEERLKAVLAEVKDSEGAAMLFIDEIHTVLGAGATSGTMDAANLLKPALARGDVRVIGATTITEFKEIERDPAFERRFQRCVVKEPTVPDAVSILRGLRERYENHHGVRILDSALVAAAKLSARYINARFLPDKAIDLLDEACASIRVQLDSKPEVIDKLERRKLQLEVEATALEREKDSGSKARLSLVRKELSQINDELTPLLLQFQSEKQKMDEVGDAQKKLEEKKAKLAAAMRSGDTTLAADLRYYAIPDLERRIQTLQVERKQEEEQRMADIGNKGTSTVIGHDEQTPLLSAVVGPDHIADVVSRWTGIPVARMRQSDSERVLALGEELSKRVVGQEEAVRAVQEAIVRSRAGLGETGRPMGSFLFLGPTGTGKTELSKALTQQLFDDEKQLLRFDMSEYMEKHAVARLVGAPPGYVGHDDGGQLTEAVRREPYRVLLFDEVEKAHKDIWDVLLQVLDDGRLTDGKGRVVDFSNTVVIMTSNLGSAHLLQACSAPNLSAKAQQKLLADAKKAVLEEVSRHFRPEFLNRLDEMVVFEPLGMDSLHRIVQLQVAQVNRRLKEKDLEIRVSPAAANYILQQSYDPAYGARPVRRYVERHIVTELSRRLLKGELHTGEVAMIDAQEDRLVVTSVARSEESPSNYHGKSERMNGDTNLSSSQSNLLKRRKVSPERLRR